MALPSETYTHGHSDAVLRSHRWRTAANSAGYLLPLLRPGQRLLDVGCGPGTITVDLARRIAPGEAIGIDREREPLTEAANLAASLNITNTTFAIGNVYDLGYPDGSFDVVHAHQVLQHLSEPVAALVEMRRVCAPDGWLAVRDADFSAMAWYPDDGRLRHWLDLYRQVARSNGGEPDAGRRLLAWAHAAGLRDPVCSASVWCYSTPEERAWWGGLWAERCTSSGFAHRALALGLASAGDLEDLAGAWRSWAESDDGWFAVLNAELLAHPTPAADRSPATGTH